MENLTGRSISSLGGSYMQSNGGNMSIGDKMILSAAIGGTAEALGGGKFSNGDGARLLSNFAYYTPYVDQIYGAIDVGYGIAGYSLTDRFGDWIDYHLGNYQDVNRRFFIQQR